MEDTWRNYGWKLMEAQIMSRLWLVVVVELPQQVAFCLLFLFSFFLFLFLSPAY